MFPIFIRIPVLKSFRFPTILIQGIWFSPLTYQIQTRTLLGWFPYNTVDTFVIGETLKHAGQNIWWQYSSFIGQFPYRWPSAVYLLLAPFSLNRPGTGMTLLGCNFACCGIWEYLPTWPLPTFDWSYFFFECNRPSNCNPSSYSSSNMSGLPQLTVGL